MSQSEANVTAAGGDKGSGKDARSRSAQEIVQAIEAERARLKDSVDDLRGEVGAFKAKVLSPRVLGAVGGALGGLILLRILRRRRG